MTETVKDLYDNEVIDLFRKNHKVMFGWLVRRGIPRPVAEEIVNDVFAAVRRRWPDIRTGRPLSYAYTIATNECTKWWKKNQDEESHRHHGSFDDQRDERDEMNEIINRLTLTQAIADLSPREREIIELRFFQQLSVSEAAEKLGLSQGSIKGYTHSAINRLRGKVGLDYTERGEEEQ